MKELFFPTPQEPPTVKFGKLPKLEFPPNTNQKPFTYKINTLTGTLPALKDRLAVHKIVQPEPTLLSLKRAQNALGSVGFRTQPIQLSDKSYQWTANDPPYKKIVFDIVSFNFTLSSNYINDPDTLTAKDLPTEAGATEKAFEFLQNIEVFPTDIDQEKTKTKLFAIQNGILTPATSLSNAHVIRVDLFQKNVNDVPILYENPDQSPMYLLVVSTLRGAEVVAGEFYHYDIMEESATYPIYTTEQALDQLRKGKAYISSYNGDANEIAIHNMYPAYFLAKENNEFLLPIIVFEGNDEFSAYLPAITDEWVGR